MNTIEAYNSYVSALYALKFRYAREIEQDACAHIRVLIAIPSTTALGDIIETVTWCKNWELGEELFGLPTTLRHWSIATSVKAEYLPQFLTMLYGAAHGMVYEEVRS